MNTAPPPHLMTEKEVSTLNNIPRAKLREWRESGALEGDIHWQKSGQAFMLTPEGRAKVIELSGLPAIHETPAPDTGIQVSKLVPGVLPRFLRGHRRDDGTKVSIRLTAPNTFASQFRFNDVLTVTPAETPGIYQYAGLRPRRIAL